MPRRSDIPRASCKRIVQSGAAKDASRMGEDATEAAHQQLDLLVSSLARHCGKQLVLMKRKTVSLDILRSVVEAHASCRGITDADYLQANRKGKGQRGLPLAGVERHFKAGLSGDVRVSEEAKEALVGISEAVLRTLGARASLMAKAGKRQTIQAADIKAAASL